jgi:hypothetical protein
VGADVDLLVEVGVDLYAPLLEADAAVVEIAAECRA